MTLTASEMKRYRKDHPEYVKGHRVWQLRYRTSHLMWLIDYLKTHPCVDCGEDNPIVLEFDHLRKSKNNKDVASLTHASIKRLLKEINKCDVVCANCHTIRTARRANSERWRLWKKLKS